MFPRIRIPLWLAAVLPLAAYAFRSLVLRGGDWRPDLPWDPILFVALGVLIALVGWARSRSEAEERKATGAPDEDTPPPSDTGR